MSHTAEDWTQFLEAPTLAFRLKQARDALRKLAGGRYQETVGEFRMVLRKISAGSGKTILECALAEATQAQREDEHAGALWMLAAAVEEIEAATEPEK